MDINETAILKKLVNREREPAAHPKHATEKIGARTQMRDFTEEFSCVSLFLKRISFIRAADDSRLVIPNEKLASDTIRNLTIRSTENVAEITVQVPLQNDLDALLDALRADTGGDVYVSALEDDNAVITLRERAGSHTEAEQLAHDLRLRAHRRLRAAGVYG